jgi:hypothetical protein
MNAVESFFSEYEKTIQAMGAISTFAAVVVSLWIANSGSKIKLRAHLSFSALIHESIDPNNRPEYLTISITNTGGISFRVPWSFFHWKLPFSKVNWMISPMDSFGNDIYVPIRKYPFKLEPRHSESFFLADKKTFKDEMRRCFGDLKYFVYLRAHLIKAVIHTDDGTRFVVKLSKTLINELLESAKSSKKV